LDFHADGEAPWSPMRQLGAATWRRNSPKLTHGAQVPTNYPVAALVACIGHFVTGSD